MSSDATGGQELPRFDRRFFEGRETFSTIGAGALGGKASGLLAAREALADRPASLHFEDLEISVPTLTVITTGVFGEERPDRRAGENRHGPSRDEGSVRGAFHRSRPSGAGSVLLTFGIFARRANSGASRRRRRRGGEAA